MSSTFPKAVLSKKAVVNEDDFPIVAVAERSDLRKRDMNEIWDQSLPVSHMSQPKLTRLKQLLYLRHITDGTLNRFNVRAISSLDGLIFPRYTVTMEMMGPQVRPNGLKICRLVETINMTTIADEIMPSGNAFHGMSGYHLVRQADSEIVVTLNEADAMAIYQASSKLAIVLPEIAGQFNIDLFLPYLEEFGKVIVWFPPEKHNRAKQLSKRLLSSQCYLISPKTSNNLRAAETLSIPGKGRELVNGVIRHGEVIAHKYVDTLPMLRDAVRSYVFGFDRQNVGLVQWKRFSLLNNYLKGFRMGEVTLLTGPYGCGKKTFLCEYALDLCDQNVSTLWCGLEMPSTQIVATMIEQYARDTFHKDISRQQSFDYWYDQLSQLPIYFSRFTGFTKLKSLVEVIEYHASAQDIQHVVIDNALLITEQGQKSVFTELKRLALARHLHITAIVHPRQEFEDGVSVPSSLQGSLEGAYEADNILRISTHMNKRQSYEMEKYFQIWKNRNVGELLLGYAIEMHFDPLSKCHSLVERKRKPKHAFNT